MNSPSETAVPLARLTPEWIREHLNVEQFVNAVKKELQKELVHNAGNPDERSEHPPPDRKDAA